MRHISKIGLKLMAIVLVVVIIPLTLMYLKIKTDVKDILTEKIKVINIKNLGAAYHEIERFVAEAESLTAELGKSDTVNLVINGIPDLFANDVEELRNKYPWMARCEIVTEDGGYFTYPEVGDVNNLQNKDWYITTKESGTLSWFPALNSSEQFRVAVPITLSYSDEVVGVFSILIDSMQFVSIMQNYSIDKSTMLLVNSQGIVLGSDRESEIDSEKFVNQSFFNESFKTEEILFGIYDYANKERLTFIKHIPLVNSVLMLQVPKSDAFEDINILLRQLKNISLITLLIIIGVMAFVTRIWISDRIKQLVISAESIAQGNFTEKIQKNGNDEIGDLADTLNEMTSHLRKLILDILDKSREVKNASQKIFGSVQLSTKVSEQVSSSIQQVASGAEDQSHLIDEVNVKLNYLNNIVDGLTDNSKNEQDIASETQAKANHGTDTMNRVVEQMDVIQKSIVKSNSVINEMTNAADEIANIVNIIESIAKQTNLLALNAAIEAARAGEDGRGFGVVAREIRALAEEVSVSAGKIRKLVDTTQNYSKLASSVMEEGAKQIELGQDVVAESKNIFNDIFTSFDTTLTAIQKTKEMIDNVSSNMTQIVSGAERISNIAEENAASAEEVSASTEEQFAAMDEIERLSESLSDLSNSLDEMVSRFKV